MNQRHSEALHRPVTRLASSSPTGSTKSAIANNNQVDDLNAMVGRVDHVLTLFSGGLDSSYVLKELADRGLHTTALAINVGESGHVQDLQDIADFFGATLKVVDAKESFATEAVLPAIRAQARYIGMYPVSSSLSRPVLARCAVQAASELGCSAIVHTANQSQNSLRRLNGAIAQLEFKGCFDTPYECSILTREEKIEALRLLGLTRFQARGISGDANLWCREFESRSIDNPEGFWVPLPCINGRARPACPSSSGKSASNFTRGCRSLSMENRCNC